MFSKVPVVERGVGGCMCWLKAWTRCAGADVIVVVVVGEGGDGEGRGWGGGVEGGMERIRMLGCDFL